MPRDLHSFFDLTESAHSPERERKESRFICGRGYSVSQSVSALDVSKSINFCKQLGFPVLGVIENMSGFICPHCGEETPIFSSGSGADLAAQYGVKLLGRIPIDPLVCQCGDEGKPFVHFAGNTAAGRSFREIVDSLELD